MTTDSRRPSSPATKASPPEAWAPLVRIARAAAGPLERFLRIEAASGIALLLAAAFAFAMANSPWSKDYLSFWHTPIGLRIGNFVFDRPLEWVVNDGLMAIFFFVVGMEIRREAHRGELSEWRRAALPIAAALGGMAAPAVLYLLLAGRPETHSGWGVPMATDIAFAVGILALLGNRVPAALRVLLLAVAVIDDLGAIVVIALFYSSGLVWGGFGFAALGLFAIFGMQRVGVRSKLAYVAPAFLVWCGVYASGVHPTIAGVVVGVITPVNAWLGPEGFVHDAAKQLERIDGANDISSHELATRLRRVDAARREAMSPAESLIETLHPWVAYLIMPVFALANAGVVVTHDALDPSAIRVVVGVAAGLVVGKPLGILLACWIVLRVGIAKLPIGIGFRQLAVLGLVAGIGFTMALFIAQLAFSNATFLAGAKLGVLGASVVAGILALIVGRVFLSPHRQHGEASTADDAEASTEA